jgi:hypothetical protein
MTAIRSRASDKLRIHELNYLNASTQSYQMIKELINETLKPNGKWSIKRLSAFTSFWIAVMYALLPLFKPFKVHEFVFVGLLTYSATAIGLTVWNKKIKEPHSPAQDI